MSSSDRMSKDFTTGSVIWVVFFTSVFLTDLQTIGESY